MSKEVSCIHCGAMSSELSCSYCGQPAISSEMIEAAQIKAREAIAKMRASPNSCAVFEETISDDTMLFALGWEGTRALFMALNQIHVEHDAPSLHGASTLFS